VIHPTRPQGVIYIHFPVHWLLKGFMIGLLIGAPFGPIGILCIKRMINQGKMAGLTAGLGAATGDAAYGFIAAFGLTFVSDFLRKHLLFFRWTGGLFLCFLGIRMMLAPVTPRNIQSVDKGGLLAGYTSTFLLTVTNPVNILSFAVIFAALGAIRASNHFLAAAITVAGVFSGSALWWILMGVVFTSFRDRFTDRVILWTNRISGAIITILGLLALFSKARFKV
jgi:threonine/homoserine/homoserine lactone efflux protein